MTAVGTPSEQLGSRRRSTHGKKARRPFAVAVVPYLLMAPAVFVILVVLGYPLYRLVVLSLQHYTLSEIISHKTHWIGLKNYSQIFGDKKFWTILERTVAFTAFNVAMTMILGTLIALLLRKVSAWVKVLVNTAMIFVWATPVVVTIIVWQWLVDQQSGVLNYALTHVLHIGDFDRHDWFRSPLSGFAIISALVVWGALPFVVISLYAGISQVPSELEEAARVDGASAVRVFRSVIYPIVKPLFLIVTSLSIIWDFGVFNQVYILLNTKPPSSYYLMSIYSYQESFGVGNYGRGAAIAMVIVLILVVAAYFYIRQLLRIGEVD
jgi:N,N'-diacetylchitobiose transport system permease protein